MPYPSEDIERIEEEYKTDSFVEDFYSYTSLIDGNLSYVLFLKKFWNYKESCCIKAFYKRIQNIYL
ncbi:YxiJ family protein [Bacillus toyonensis]